MTYNPDIHQRHSIRMKDYDYSKGGGYFVTICTWQRECLFGEMANGEMVLNEMGRIVESVWRALPVHFTHISLDQYVVMPNHFHGILQLTGTVESSGAVGAKQGSSALPAVDLPESVEFLGAVGAKQGLSALPAVDLCAGTGEADETCFAPTVTAPTVTAPTISVDICGIENKVKAVESFALSLRSLKGTVSGSFCAIIQNFKSISTRKINRFRNNAGCPVWQRNYYERIIRDENELFRAREYIINNPLKWELDKENPDNFNATKDGRSR